MRFTFGWLKENLDFDGSPLELCEKLTSIGLEVENFSDPKDALCNFIDDGSWFGVSRFKIFSVRCGFGAAEK